MTTVLVTDFAWTNLEIERGIIEAAGFKLVSGPAEALPADEIAALAAEHGPDAIMTCWAEVNAAAIDACPNLSIVARIGVGLDNIDRVAAARRGAVVTNVPDYCVEEVSDHAVGFLLAIARGIVTFDRDVKQGLWEPGSAQLMRVRDMTVGIAGYGRIGRRTAEKLAAFGVKLLVTDAVRPTNAMPGIEYVDLELLAKHSDAIIIHLPLTPDTKHMFGASLLRQMKRDAILINVSRGPLVDSKALVAALDEGLIAGAALDVVEGEPNNVPRKLVDHPRVIATPHVAFSSTASLLELRRRATEEVVRVLSGEKPVHPCPPPGGG